MVCKIIFCSEFPDSPDKVGRITKRRRTRRTGNCKEFYVSRKRNKKALELSFQFREEKDLSSISRLFLVVQ